MIRSLLLILPLLLLMQFSFAQSHIYLDFTLGLHPALVDNAGTPAHVNIAIGRQPSQYIGYGVSLGSVGYIGLGSGGSFSTLGLQYRLLDKENRFCGKVELGSVLDFEYADDGNYSYEYPSTITPYLKTQIAYHLGKFLIGARHIYIGRFQETVSELGAPPGAPTDSYNRDFADLFLFVGISLGGK